MKERNIRILIVLLSLTIFIVSLTKNAIIINENEPQSALSYFLIGSIAFIGSGLFEEIIWLANPIALLSMIIFISNDKRSIKFSLISLIIAVSFSFWNNILANEGGATTEIVSFESGYYLWVFSIVVLNIGIYLYYKSYKSKSL